MALKRQKGFALAILALAILLVLAACGPQTITNPDGSVKVISQHEYLGTVDAEFSQRQIQLEIGTFTPTATSTPTFTPTTTATPTITPTPTMTQTPTAYFAMVENKNGQELSRSLYPPDCSGEWGNPGIDIWKVEGGEPVKKVCSTPWNRFQNWLIQAGKYFLWLIGAIFVAGIFYNIFGGKPKKTENAPTQKLLPMAPTTALARRKETQSFAMTKVVLSELRKENPVLFGLVIKCKKGIEPTNENAWPDLLTRVNQEDPLVLQRLAEFVNQKTKSGGNNE